MPTLSRNGSPAPSSFGGLLFPLDAFRASALAAVLGEALAAKARNVNDAQLVLRRHPAAPLVLAQIEGTVVGGDPAGFWRDNADLALVASQVFPREVFLVYAKTAPAAERAEAYLVAGQGQMLGAEEATAERLGPNAPADAWPLSRLCGQIGITLDDLTGGFAGGPAVRVSLLEPTLDDRDALMRLAGQGGGEPASPEAPAPAAEAGAEQAPSDEERRRRRKEAEARERAARAAEVERSLPFVVDELGAVVAPAAELDEADIVGRYVVHPVTGDLPPGLPRDLAPRLEGRRIDAVVPVSFLSEVFVGNRPLDKKTWQAKAEPVTLGGRSCRRLLVHGPRLGPGTLVECDGRRVFVSRTPDMPLPEAFVCEVLGQGG